MITKEQAIDIVNKFDFFYGNRAGRELWLIKPTDVQDTDVKNFSDDCVKLLEYIMSTGVAMVKCDKWQEIDAFGNSVGCCNGTKEQDPCSCNGDATKCDFYATVRQKALEQEGEKVLTKTLNYFQWNSMDTIPTDFTDDHRYILVCYIEHGDVRYQSYESLTKNILENSFVGKHAIAWCYIKPPNRIFRKEEATKKLQSVGVLDKDGNVVPFYADVLAKLTDDE